MRYTGLLLTALTAGALSACGNQDSSRAERSGDTPPPTAQQAAKAAAPAFASVYTSFDLSVCTVLSEEREEGSSAEYSCPGFGKTALLVQEGDGRFDLDVGVDDDGFQTIGAFNDIADTIEWRLQDGQPVAVIFRYRDVSQEAQGRTVLAVETVGSAAQPGCRVAQIAGDTPDANTRAREQADAAAANDFSCPDQPTLTGAAS